MIESLLLSLQSRDVVSADEQEILRRLIAREKLFLVDEDIVSEGARPVYSCLLIDGFAARYKVMGDGNRQITALHVPGDFIDLHGYLLKTMDHSIVAISPCRVGFADHSALRDITEQNPHLARLLWLDTLIDGAIHREWIVAMGRRSKKAHIAHLVCELYVRLSIVNKTVGFQFYFPLTQLETADVLGISLVHLNKTLQVLRKDKLLTWINQTITILDWQGLTELAQFDETYLSRRSEPR